MNPNLKQSLWHWFWTVLTTVIFGLTAAFARKSVSVDLSFHGSSFFAKFSSTLAILRFLQGITSTLTSLTCNETLELIQWSLLTSNDGIRLLTFLSISPTTGVWGLLQMLGKRPKACDRAWAVCRLILMTMTWLAGFLLFVNTRVAIVYDPFLTFTAVAGVGPFNGSFVENKLNDTAGAITYQVLVYANNFVTDSQFSVVATSASCSAGCDSYIFPGALWSLDHTPLDNPLTDTFVTVNNAPAIQMDFTKGLSDGDEFDLSGPECTLYGENGNVVGIIFCLAKSKVHGGSIIAGVFVCRGGVSNGECVLGGIPLNISTTFTVYSLLATTTCASNNNSILSISDLGRPTQSDVDMNGLDIALHWLLNYTAQGLPAVSAIAYLFWEAQGLSYHDWSIAAYRSLKSLIAFPIWEFSRNNFGDPRVEPLPDEFKISASLSRPYYKIILDSRLFVTYVVLQSTVIMCCWAVIVWRLVCRIVIAELSSYPLVDFAAKLVEKVISGEHHSIWDFRADILWNAKSAKVLKTLKNVKVIRRIESEMVEASHPQFGEVVGLLNEDGERTGEVEANHIVDLSVTENDDSEAQGAVSDNVTERNGGHEGSGEGAGTEEGERGEEGEVDEDEGLEEGEGGEEDEGVEEDEEGEEGEGVEEDEGGERE